jgi:hypothetical protein
MFVRRVHRILGKSIRTELILNSKKQRILPIFYGGDLQEKQKVLLKRDNRQPGKAGEVFRINEKKY